MHDTGAVRVVEGLEDAVDVPQASSTGTGPAEMMSFSRVPWMSSMTM